MTIFPQRVLYGQGAQTLYFVPRDEYGRPSEATTPFATIVDLRKAEGASDRTVEARAAITVSSASEALTAAAGPSQADARLLTVADTSGFTEGRSYLLKKTDGQREQVTIERIDSATAFHAQEPLEQDFAISDTLVGFELHVDFPSSEASDEGDFDDQGGPYQVLWEYTVNGQKYLVPEVIWLVRYSVVPLISVADVKGAFPTLASRINDRFGLERAVVMASQDYAGDLQAAGKSEVYLRAPLAGRKAQRCKAIEWALRWIGDHEDADRWEDRYDKLMGDLLTGRAPVGTVEVDPVNDDAPAGSSKGYGQHLFRRS